MHSTIGFVKLEQFVLKMLVKKKIKQNMYNNAHTAQLVHVQNRS